MKVKVLLELDFENIDMSGGSGGALKYPWDTSKVGQGFSLALSDLKKTDYRPTLPLRLKKRGVKFEFFHKVKSLNMSEDEQSIDSIDMKIQATTKEGKEYQPLIDVKGLPCWPSYPLYDQLEQGEEIKEKGINLETYYTDWKAVKEIKIKKGIDFDEVIQGISVGALPTIAKDIIDKKPAWKQMVEKVTTTPTQCWW